MRRQVLVSFVVCVVISYSESTIKRDDGGYGYGGGYGHTGGGYGGGYGGDFIGHGHGYGGIGKGKGKGILVHKPVLVKKPIVVHQPAVEYKKVYYQPPPPPPPPPIWVKKPVIQSVKEWRLVEVPKVTYQSVLVHPTPYYEKKKGPFKKFFDQLKLTEY